LNSRHRTHTLFFFFSRTYGNNTIKLENFQNLFNTNNNQPDLHDKFQQPPAAIIDFADFPTDLPDFSWPTMVSPNFPDCEREREDY
jgi:hypothetical protein